MVADVASVGVASVVAGVAVGVGVAGEDGADVGDAVGGVDDDCDIDRAPLASPPAASYDLYRRDPRRTWAQRGVGHIRSRASVCRNLVGIFGIRFREGIFII